MTAVAEERTAGDGQALRMAAGAALRIDSSANTPRDHSADLELLKVKSLIRQRDTLIEAIAMTRFLFPSQDGGKDGLND